MKNDLNKRYDNIDLLKVIAILMVVPLHTGLFVTNFIKANSVGTYVQYAIRLICEGVPLFILINGFLLINKQFDLKKHMRKILKIFLLIAIWSTIFICLKDLIEGKAFSIKSFITNFLNTNISSKKTGELWFLQNLIMLYILFPIIKVLHDSNKRVYNYFTVILFLFTFGTNLLNLIIEPLSYITKCNEIKLITTYISKYNPFSNSIFLSYFILGGILHEKECNESQKMKIYILAIISYIGVILYGYGMSFLYNKTYSSNYNYSQIFLLIIYVAIFYLSNNYRNKGNIFNKIIMSISKNTMGIYFIHWIITFFENQYLNVIDYPLVYRLIITFLIFLLSYIISILISKIPKLNSIIKL